jgi:hypothetical protein
MELVEFTTSNLGEIHHNFILVGFAIILIGGIHLNTFIRSAPQLLDDKIHLNYLKMELATINYQASQLNIYKAGIHYNHSLM